jgi:hypothetical protein
MVFFVWAANGLKEIADRNGLGIKLFYADMTCLSPPPTTTLTGVA